MVSNAAGDRRLMNEDAARRIPVRYAKTAGPRDDMESIADKAMRERRGEERRESMFLYDFLL